MLIDIWSEKRWGVLFSALFGLLCTALSLILLSALSCFLLETVVFVPSMAVSSLITGGLTGGYICGKLRRRRGFIEGLAVGAVMFAILTVVSLILSGNIPSLSKLLLLGISGASGGVYGVNSKRLSRVYCSGHWQGAGQSRDNPVHKKQRHRRH